MSLSVEHTIKIGAAASPTDFTTRVAGYTVNQQLTWMAPSSFTATITLHNFDGALTPAEAGGTGTYSTVDWFAQAVFISATVNSTDTGEIFHGLITDFRLVDDGVTSTVTITAVDHLSIAGRGPTEFPGTVSGSVSMFDGTEELLEKMLGYTVDTLPLLGASTGVAVDVKDRTSTTTSPLVDLTPVLLEPRTIADALRNMLMPSGLCLLWADRITGTATTTTYVTSFVGPALERVTTTPATYYTARTFEFVPTPAAGQLAATSLDVGYNDRQRINWASITSASTTNTREHVNTAAVNQYGVQAFTASSSLNYNDDTYTAGGTTYLGSDATAAQLANRFSSTAWTPRRLTTTVAALSDLPAGSSDELAGLFDMAGGLWQRCNITYTPTGGSSTTSRCMIMGRTIQATPGRCTITLELVPADDFQPFILGDATYGVLGRSRLAI